MKVKEQEMKDTVLAIAKKLAKLMQADSSVQTQKGMVCNCSCSLCQAKTHCLQGYMCYQF